MLRRPPVTRDVKNLIIAVSDLPEPAILQVLSRLTAVERAYLACTTRVIAINARHKSLWEHLELSMTILQSPFHKWAGHNKQKPRGPKALENGLCRLLSLHPIVTKYTKTVKWIPAYPTRVVRIPPDATSSLLDMLEERAPCLMAGWLPAGARLTLPAVRVPCWPFMMRREMLVFHSVMCRLDAASFHITMDIDDFMRHLFEDESVDSVSEVAMQAAAEALVELVTLKPTAKWECWLGPTCLFDDAGRQELECLVRRLARLAVSCPRMAGICMRTYDHRRSESFIDESEWWRINESGEVTYGVDAMF